MSGLLITLEGMDGAGKSTHIPAIVEQIQALGHNVVMTREPGGTPLGEKLRALLLHEAMHAETETLLMFAARREHLAQVIVPAIEANNVVISDRFTDATFAYQSGAKGVAHEKIAQLERWVQGEGADAIQPNLTLLFDVPTEVSLARLANARTPDKFEREGAVFFEKLRQVYLQRAADFPQRFRVINAHRSLAEVAAEVREIIHNFMQSHR